MSLCPHFVLLATYNEWMNHKIYEAACALPQDALVVQRGAYFGSILGTLNHIVVGDTLWLKRFAAHPISARVLEPVVLQPQPAALDQILFDDVHELRRHRQWLDAIINDWVLTLVDDDINSLLNYRNSQGVPARRRYASLLLHFFNHQTHHRGQVTALLSQAGQDVGVTDLLALIPNQ